MDNWQVNDRLLLNLALRYEDVNLQEESFQIKIEQSLSQKGAMILMNGCLEHLSPTILVINGKFSPAFIKDFRLLVVELRRPRSQKQV